jgi:hypothetical protein
VIPDVKKAAFIVSRLVRNVPVLNSIEMSPLRSETEESE